MTTKVLFLNYSFKYLLKLFQKGEQGGRWRSAGTNQRPPTANCKTPTFKNWQLMLSQLFGFFSVVFFSFLFSFFLSSFASELILSRNMVNMLSNAKNNHSIKFLGSELYGKMCWFVSMCCLLQMLCHFLYNFFDFSGSGRVQQRVKNEGFGHNSSLVPSLILK